MDLVDEHTVDGVKFKVTGTGEYERCETLLVPFVKNQTAPCSDPPCSLNGVHQTPINYKEAEFFGFAEFWYSTNDVLRIGGKYLYEKLQKTAKVCSLDFKDFAIPKILCFDFLWINIQLKISTRKDC